MSTYYDIDGRPMTMKEWATAFEDTEARIIGRDEIDGVRISTVWLGIDHSFSDMPALIFETMIFGGRHDEYQQRYSSKAEAEAGHAAAVKLVRSEG